MEPLARAWVNVPYFLKGTENAVYFFHDTAAGHLPVTPASDIAQAVRAGDVEILFTVNQPSPSTTILGLAKFKD